MTTTNDALRILDLGATPTTLTFCRHAVLYARRATRSSWSADQRRRRTSRDGRCSLPGDAAEAAASGPHYAEYVTLDIHDGALLPSLENRHTVIAVIRQFRPDLVMVHRPNDYHPDHRYASQLVQDASYMVTVPNVVSHVPHLRAMPVIVHTWDHFQKPYPFQADVVIGIDEVVEQKVDALLLPRIAGV